MKRKKNTSFFSKKCCWISLMMISMFLIMPSAISKSNASSYIINDYAVQAAGDSLPVSEDNTVSLGDATYEIATGRAILTHYSNRAGRSTFEIPDYVDFKGEKIPVVAVGNNVTPAFYDAYGDLHSIKIGKNVREILDLAFSGCRLNSEMVIPGNVVLIGKKAFGDNALFKQLVIEDGEEPLTWEISGYESFPYVERLSINKQTNFYWFSSSYISLFPKLKELYLSEHVTRICKYTFYGCKSLTELFLPTSISDIETMAFANCGFTAVSIPPSVEHIGLYAFSTSTLARVNIEKGNSNKLRLGGDVFGNSLEYVYKGRNIGVISKECVRRVDESMPFMNQGKLKEVLVGGDCTDLEWNDFKDCPKLEHVTLEASVRALSRMSFDGCKAIKNITVQNVTPPLYASFEQDVYDKATLTVPDESLGLYKAAEGWKNFFNVETTGISSVMNHSKNINYFDLNGRQVTKNYKGIVVEKNLITKKTRKVRH